MKLVLASNNRGKLAELQAMLAPLGVEAIEMPATPARIWAAIEAARARKGDR